MIISHILNGHRPIFTLQSLMEVLRIDNSGRSMICAFDHMSETVPVTRTCHTSNKRIFFLSFHVNVIVNKFDLRILSFKNLFVHFYFF